MTDKDSKKNEYLMFALRKISIASEEANSKLGTSAGQANRKEIVDKYESETKEPWNLISNALSKNKEELKKTSLEDIKTQISTKFPHL